MQPSARPTTNDAPADERIVLLDALRGLALIGILAVNMEYFSQSVHDGWMQPELRDWPDLAARWLVIALFQLKAYLLFALLFGYGIGLQTSDRGREAIAPVRARHRRRMGVLALIGVAHATLLFVGDILVTYALLGLISMVFWQASVSRLLLWSALAFAEGLIVVGALVVLLPADAPMTVDIGAIRDIYAHGTALEVIAQRVADLTVAFPFVLAVQGPMAFSMLLIGIAMARAGLLVAPREHGRTLRSLRRWGLGIGVPLGVAAATLSVAGHGDDLATVAGFGLQLLGAPAFCLGVVASAALLDTRRWSGALVPLTLSGRLSLTNYIAQSLLGALIFTSLGLGLFAQLGPAACLAIAAGIAAVLALSSRWWLGRYRFGPLEWLLRSATYRRRMPLGRQAAGSDSVSGRRGGS
mgnify:CR=1 FL=1